MAHELINKQRKLKIKAGAFSTFLVALDRGVEEAEGRPATIVLVSDRKMRELNRFFRGKDSTTDVLSFPFFADEFEGDGGADQLGDIVISAEQAARQAKENGLTLENEIKQLILHGMLHLCGYDHETDKGEMNRLELKLRKRLKI